MSRTTLHHRCRGLTLLELLLAFSITAIIGLAMATVMTTAARGLTGASEGRSGLQRAHAAYLRTRAYTDSALDLLAVDPNRGFAIWLHDEKPGQRVNMLELRVFWWNNGDGTLTVERVRTPVGWAPELVDNYNIVLASSADFFQVMLDQRVLGMTASEVIADGITNAGVSYGGNDPQSVQRFRLSLTVSTGQGAEEPVLLTLGLLNYLKPV